MQGDKAGFPVAFYFYFFVGCGVWDLRKREGGVVFVLFWAG